jgi:hypothetical protein
MAFPQTAFSGDTRLLKWKKILGRYQNAAGAKSANDPKRGDTRYRTILKVLRAMQGAPFDPAPPQSQVFLADSQGNELTDSTGNKLFTYQ